MRRFFLVPLNRFFLSGFFLSGLLLRAVTPSLCVAEEPWRAYVGCYQLSVKPLEGLNPSEKESIPRWMELTDSPSEVPACRHKGYFVAEPRFKVRDGCWKPKPEGGISIRWSDGMGGILVLLAPANGVLAGKAKQLAEEGAYADWTDAVVGRRTPCDKLKK